jgi:hypothetical protein
MFPSLAMSVAVLALAQDAGAPRPAVAPKPLPRSHGGLDLGKPSFTLLHECQTRGWGFYARAGERVVSRRGVRYALTAAHVIPGGDEVLRYRLSFLDGRLAGLRVEFRTPDPNRFAQARALYGPPAWEASDRAEWISPDRSTALAAWRDGGRLEIVDLGLARSRGFFTEAEIAEELKRRGKPPPK